LYWLCREDVRVGDEFEQRVDQSAKQEGGDDDREHEADRRAENAPEAQDRRVAFAGRIDAALHADHMDEAFSVVDPESVAIETLNYAPVLDAPRKLSHLIIEAA